MSLIKTMFVLTTLESARCDHFQPHFWNC